MIRKPFVKPQEQGAVSFTDLSVWCEMCLAQESVLGHPFPSATLLRQREETGEAIFTWERAVFSKESKKDEVKRIRYAQIFFPQAVSWNEINMQSSLNITSISLLLSEVVCKQNNPQ